jgi:type IV secretion system protein VirB5
MKPSKKNLIAAALILFSNASSAVDIVSDPAHMEVTAAGWGAQATSWATQIEEMKRQFDQLQTTYNSLTGNRGFGDVLPLSNSIRNYLPASAGDILDVINGASTTYNNMSGMVQTYTDQNAILSSGAITNLNMNADQLKLFNQRRNNIAAIQAYATQSIDAASLRFGYIQQLMDQVSATNDPKGIAELNARIAGEQVMLQNDQAKMQQMYAYLQNQELMNQQQMRELAIQQVGSVGALQQPNLSVINYSTP